MKLDKLKSLVYKNIDTVLAYQEGVVVKVVDKITPMVNIKTSGK